MKIGELAKATGTQTETIRYYEREQLLPAATRTESNYRVYDDSHVERLAFIRHCRCLDMTLDEIRVLLHFKDAPGENCGAVDALLQAHIGHVVSRIRELQALEVARKDGTLAILQRGGALPVKATGSSKTRAQVQQEYLNMSAAEKERIQELYSTGN